MSDEFRPQETDAKSEVVAAYQELLRKLTDSRKMTPQEEAIIEEKQQIVAAVVHESPDTLSQQFISLKHTLSNGLDSIKDAFIKEQKKLADLVDAIEFKRNELAELHKIEANVNSLQALIIAQREKTAEFEHEMQLRRKEWQQEEQKYAYQRDISREKERNQYEISKRNMDKEINNMRMECQRDIDERKAAISAVEHELVFLKQLQERVAQFPAELEHSIKQAEDNLSRQLTMQYDYEAQLLQKEIQVQAQTIMALENKIALLETNIAHFESLKNSFNKLLLNSVENVA